MQRLCSRVRGRRRSAVRERLQRLTLISVSLTLLPALAGCSSYSMSGSPTPQQTAAAPPAAAVPPAAPQPAYDPVASVYPQQSLVDLFKGSTEARSAADPTVGAYPQQPLISSATPAQAAAVPHPPSTYTPVDQPYTAARYTPVAAGQPVDDTAASAMPYPSQSLTDVFRGSTASSTQTAVPHPPSTYSATAQPYAPPPGQPGYGSVPAGAAPAPTNPDPAASAMPYPQQSLWDVFSNKNTAP
jgi:hypothetical protein